MHQRLVACMCVAAAAADSRTGEPTTAAAGVAVLGQLQPFARKPLKNTSTGKGASSPAQSRSADSSVPSAEGVASLAAPAAATSLEQQGETQQRGDAEDVQRSDTTREANLMEEICSACEVKQEREEVQRPPPGAEALCFVAAEEEGVLHGELPIQPQPAERPDAPGTDSEVSRAASPAAERDIPFSTQPPLTHEPAVLGYVGELQPQKLGKGPSPILAEGSPSAAADGAAEAAGSPDASATAQAAGDAAAATGATAPPAEAGLESAEAATANEPASEAVAAEAAAREAPDDSAVAPDPKIAAATTAHAADAATGGKAASASAAKAKAVEAKPYVEAQADASGVAAPHAEAEEEEADNSASRDAATSEAVQSAEIVAAAATAGAAADLVEVLADRAATDAAAEAASGAAPNSTEEAAVDSEAAEKPAAADAAVEEAATPAQANRAADAATGASGAEATTAAADVTTAAVTSTSAAADAAAEASAAPLAEAGAEAAEVLSSSTAAADAVVDADAAVVPAADAAADTAADFASAVDALADPAAGVDLTTHAAADAEAAANTGAAADTAADADLTNHAAADAAAAGDAAAVAEAAADTAADLPADTAAAGTTADVDFAADADVVTAAEAADLNGCMTIRSTAAPAGLPEGAEAPRAVADCRADAAAADTTADAAADAAPASEAREAAEAAAEADGEAAAAEAEAAEVAEAEAAEAAAKLLAPDAPARAAGPDAIPNAAAPNAAAPPAAAASDDGGTCAGEDGAASAAAGTADAEADFGAAANAAADAAAEAVAEAAAEAAAAEVSDAGADSAECATAAGSPHAIELPAEACEWQLPPTREAVADAAAEHAAGAAAADYEASACEQPSNISGPEGVEDAADMLQRMSLSPISQLPSEANAKAEETACCMQQEVAITSESVELDQITHKGGPQKSEAPEGDDEATHGILRSPLDNNSPSCEAAGLPVSLSDALPSDGSRPTGDPQQASPVAARSSEDSGLLKASPAAASRGQLLLTYSTEGAPPPSPSADAERPSLAKSGQNQPGLPSQPPQISWPQPLEPCSKSDSKTCLGEEGLLSGSRDASEATCPERALEETMDPSRGPSLLPEEDAAASAGQQPSASSQGITPPMGHTSASAAGSQAGAGGQQDEGGPAALWPQGVGGAPSEGEGRSSKQERASTEGPLVTTKTVDRDQQLLQRAQSLLASSQHSDSAPFALSPTSAGAAGSEELHSQALHLSPREAQQQQAAAGLYASLLSFESSSRKEALIDVPGPLDVLRQDPHRSSTKPTATLHQPISSKSRSQPEGSGGGCSLLPSKKRAETISSQGSFVSGSAELLSPEEARGLQASSAAEDLVRDRSSLTSQPPQEAAESSPSPQDNETASPELKRKLSTNEGEATGLSHKGAATQELCKRLEQPSGPPFSALGLTDEATSGDADLKEWALRPADNQVSIQLHASPAEQLQSTGVGVERQAAAALKRMPSASGPQPEQLEPPVSCSPLDKPGSIFCLSREVASYSVQSPGGALVKAALSSAAAEAMGGPSDAAALERKGSKGGDGKTVSMTHADERQPEQETSHGAAFTVTGESEFQRSLLLNRREPEEAPPHGQQASQAENPATTGETRKLVLPLEAFSDATALTASKICGIAPPGASSWRSERVASLAGRASASSPTQRVLEALNSLAASKRSEDLTAGEETVLVDDLVLRHAPITAPIPAPRPLAHVIGSKASSSSSSSGRCSSRQTLSSSTAGHQPPTVSRVPGEDPTTQKVNASSPYPGDPPQEPPSLFATLETILLAEASDASQTPLSARCGEAPFAIRNPIPMPAPLSRFVASRPPQMRSATPLQRRPPPPLMRGLACPPPPLASPLPLATGAPKTAAASAAAVVAAGAAAQQRHQQPLRPMSRLPASLPASPALRRTAARPPPPQQASLSPAWLPAEKAFQGLPPVNVREERLRRPQEGPPFVASKPLEGPPHMLELTQQPERPGPLPFAPHEFRMPAGPPQGAVAAPPASQQQPTPPPYLLAAAAQLARPSEQQAVGSLTASRPPPPSELLGAAATGEAPATAAAAARGCPPKRGPVEAPLPSTSSVSPLFPAASNAYGGRPFPILMPGGSVSTSSMRGLPPPRRPFPFGPRRPPLGRLTAAPPDSFFTPSLSSTNSLAVPIYASGRETPVSVRPPAGPSSLYPAAFSFAAASSAGGTSPSPLPLSAAAALVLLQQLPPVAGRPSASPPLGSNQGHAGSPAHATHQPASRDPSQEPPASRLTSCLASIRPPQNPAAAAAPVVAAAAAAPVAAAAAAAPVAAAAAPVAAAAPSSHVLRPPQFSPAFAPLPAGPREAPGGPLLLLGVPSPAAARPPRRPPPPAPPRSGAASSGELQAPPGVGGPPRPQTAAGLVPPWKTSRPLATLPVGPPYKALPAAGGTSPVAICPASRSEAHVGCSRPPTLMAPVAAAPQKVPSLTPGDLPRQLALASEGPPPHHLGPLMAGTRPHRPPVRPVLNPSSPVRPSPNPVDLAESCSRAPTPGLPSDVPAAASVQQTPGPPPTALGRPPPQSPTLLPPTAFSPVPASLRQPSPANRQLVPEPGP
ncbi:hypothetical protein Esti_004691 [Eimeria stiedai]